jgi:serine/threonine protein kinase/N-acetylneuraminic acid mutarotase
MGKVYLASHSEVAVPLAIKQTRADAPLPEAVYAELDNLLQGDAQAKRSTRLPSFEFPTSGGEHTDRFLREALLLARLQHPALPVLYDYFLEDGYWYLVMDYIPGPTLTDYLRKHGPLPPLEALNYTMQLCDVFDYLHRQSPPIIFRDLKPSNILVTPSGTLVMVDFGIARYFKVGQSNDTTDFGSPGYASPEQYQSEGQTDARSDLFSLGVLLHEMVTGERPKSPGAMLAGVSTMHESARQVNSTVSAALSGLIALATRMEPAYRFQSAHTFYLALERVYLLEERRTYQQRVLLEQAMQPLLVSPDEETALLAGNERDAVHEQEVTYTTARTSTGSILALPVLPVSKMGERSEPVYLSDNAQRRVIRETLRQMRRERKEQEELESQFTMIDEGLVRRSSISLSQLPQALPSEKESFDENVVPARPRVFSRLPALNVRRLIRVSFVVVLIIFLTLTSLLAYMRLFHHDLVGLRGQDRTTIPAHMSTPGSSGGTSGTWQHLPSLDSPEADNTAVYVQVQGRDYIYINGGYRGATQSPHYDHTLYRYDIAAAHWEAVQTQGQFPGMVNNAVASDAAGHLFYLAGYSSDSYSVSSLLYSYQLSNGTTQKVVPPSNVQLGFGASMLTDTSGHLYMTQGFLKSGDAAAGTGWYRYDIATGQWHVLAPLPVGLGYVILAPDVDGTLLLISGASDPGQQHQSQAIYRYNEANNSWTQATSNAPIALSGSASTIARPGSLVVIGGYDAVHKQGMAQVWLVDLHTLRWTLLTPLPAGGSVLGAAASDGNSHIYLERGASDPSTPTPDFWQLTL